MTAYGVTLLDCDVCGEVLDIGHPSIGAPFSDVRKIAKRLGWRSWPGVDACPRHADMSKGRVYAAVEAVRGGPVS